MIKEVKLILIKYPKTSGVGYDYVIKRTDNDDVLRIPADKELSLDNIKDIIINYFKFTDEKVNVEIHI